MGTILLIVFKYSTSTTNHFSVFPTELKDRFLAILHVYRFRLSGSSCNFLCFISMKPPSLLLAFTPVFIHTISLCHFVIHLGIKYNKNLLQTLYSVFRLSVMNNKAIWLISHFTGHFQSKEDIHMYRLIN